MGDGNQPDDPKAELLSRLNELLKELVKKETLPPSRFQRAFTSIREFLQSTFFISIIGGLLLAWLPFRWQELASRQRERELQAAQIAERKDRLAYEFAKNFPLTLHLAGRFRKRQLWMEQLPEAGRPEARYQDGRTFTETRNYTEGLIEKYFSLGPTASTCNQIAASFPASADITSLARVLSENVTSLLLATNDVGVENAFSEANANYQRLTQVIFTELNKMNENTSPPQ